MKGMCNLNLNHTSHRNSNVFVGLLEIFSPYSLIFHSTIIFFTLNYNICLVLELNFSLGNRDFMHMIRLHLLNTIGE